MILFWSSGAHTHDKRVKESMLDRTPSLLISMLPIITVVLIIVWWIHQPLYDWNDSYTHILHSAQNINVKLFLNTFSCIVSQKYEWFLWLLGIHNFLWDLLSITQLLLSLRVNLRSMGSLCQSYSCQKNCSGLIDALWGQTVRDSFLEVCPPMAQSACTFFMVINVSDDLLSWACVHRA